MIDSHCHLADEVFAGDLAAVVERAREAGVERALVVLAADDERPFESCGARPSDDRIEVPREHVV